jgi:hypothetical protein
MAELNPQDLQNILDDLKSTESATSSLRNESEKLKIALDKESSSIRKSAEQMKIINAAIKMASKSTVDLADATADLSNQQYMEARQLSNLIAKSDDAKKEVEDLTDKYELHEKSIKSATKSREKYIVSLKKEAKAEEIASAKRKVLEVAGRVPGLRTISGAISKGSQVKGGFKDAGKSLTTLSGSGAIGSGKAASMVGGLGSAISKLAGFAGAAAGGIGLVVSGLMALSKLDKWFKGLNREFIKIAGPTIGGKALKQMKEYNKSLFDIPRNIRLGINSSDIQGMFGSMSGSGMSLQGVKKRAGGYDSTIEEARRLSLQFGVDFSAMGGMIADQMVTLRSSLASVSDTFEKLSYDAQRAGISSEKFYQSVESASSSLSFYGNYMKYASDMIANFTENATMGFKDAGEITGSLLGMYKDVKDNRRISSLLDPQNVQLMAREQVKGSEQRIQNISVEIEDIENNANLSRDKKNEKIESLRKERDSITATIGAVRQFAEFGGDVTAAAEALTYLNPNKITEAVMKRQGINLLEDSATSVYAKLEKMLNMSQKDVAALRKSGFQTVGVFKNFADNIASTDLEGSLLGEAEVLETVSGRLKQVVSNEKAFDDVSGDMKDALSKVPGITGVFISDFMDAAKKAPEAMIEILKGLESGAFAGVDTPEKANQVLRKIIGESIISERKTPETGTDFSAEYLGDLVAQTEDMAKMLGITAEGIKYAIGNDFMKSIAENTYLGAVASTELFNFVSKGKNWLGQDIKDIEDRQAKNASKTQSYQKVKDRKLLQRESVEMAGYLAGKLGIDNDNLLKLRDVEGGANSEAILSAVLASNGEITDGSKELANSLMKVLAAEQKSKKYIEAQTKSGTLSKSHIQEKMDSDVNAELLARKELISKETGAKRDLAILGSYDKLASKAGLPSIGSEVTEAAMKPVPTKKDFAFGSSGYAFGSPGDILIDKESLAAGIGQGTGGLVGSTIGSMGSSGGMNNYWGGITMHISANDAKDLRDAIPDIKRSLETFVDQKIKKSLLNKETKA